MIPNDEDLNPSFNDFKDENEILNHNSNGESTPESLGSDNKETK